MTSNTDAPPQVTATPSRRTEITANQTARDEQHLRPLSGAPSGGPDAALATTAYPHRRRLGRWLILLVLPLIVTAIAGPASAATGTVGYHRDNSGWCSADGYTATRVEAPFIKSANGGWQTASWQAVLWRYNGSSWDLWQNGTVNTGTVGIYENRIGGAMQFPYVTAHGYYRVSIVYRWYTNGYVTGTDHLWVSTLYTPPPPLNYGMGGYNSYYCTY